MTTPTEPELTADDVIAAFEVTPDEAGKPQYTHPTYVLRLARLNRYTAQQSRQHLIRAVEAVRIPAKTFAKRKPNQFDIGWNAALDAVLRWKAGGG